MIDSDAGQTARRLAAQIDGFAAADLSLRAGVVPVASPMYQGVDAHAFRLASGQSSAWARVPHADAGLFCDPATLVAAASAAGRAGVGPRVLAADAGTGAVLMEDLSATHRVGTLDRLIDPAIRAAVVTARKTIQAGPPLPRARSVFSHVAQLAARMLSAGAALPPDWAWMADNLRAAGEAIAAAGADSRPAHGDGNASNLMISDAGAVLLVDFDMAASMDPYEDLGSFLAEAHAFDPQAAETFEMFHGSFDQRLFNRARLYGVADDVRWGLIGALLAASSPRRDLEFLKFAEWRFLRARFAMRDPRFEERIRRL
ncbi:MAG: phosphotransferase [Pseudomonadota bacterium]